MTFTNRQKHSYAHYEVHDDQHRLLWIGALETFGEHRFFAYVPNSDDWRRHLDLEQEFYGSSELVHFNKISRIAAANLMVDAPRIDEREGSWILSDLLAQERLAFGDIFFAREENSVA